jgi:hypothetical protein
VQKYKERLETARKSERKWQRTLKFNGLYGLSSHVKTKKASLLAGEGWLSLSFLQ